MSARKICAFLAATVAVAACSRQPAGERPQATYDPATGRLRMLRFDANHNGTLDSISYMDGARILRIELDFDENGKVERWDFYREDRTLEKIGFSTRNDGILDAQAFYTADRQLARMEISTRRDRQVDRVEFYQAGVLTRSWDDTNRDGRPDKWETYRRQPSPGPNEPAYAITSSAFDDTGSGRPERRFVYGANGEVARVEVDPDGDGTFQQQQALARKQ